MSDKILKIYYEFFFNSLELTFFKKFAIKKENALFFKSDIVLVNYDSSKRRKCIRKNRSGKNADGEVWNSKGHNYHHTSNARS